jgi:hypothetical protein
MSYATVQLACHQSVRSGLVGLALPDLMTNVTIVPDLSRDNVGRAVELLGGNLPGALVGAGGAEDDTGGTLADEDDTTYLVAVIFCDRAAADAQAPKEKYLYYREVAARRFRNKKLNGVPESQVVRVRYGLPWDTDTRAYAWMQSAMTLEVPCVSPRQPPPPWPYVDLDGAFLLDADGGVLVAA